MSDWKYFDGSNPPRPLTVGDKVNVWDNPDAVALAPGLIVKFEEPDCDYNDELGRAEMYGPYCFVQWPEALSGDVDKLTGQCRMTWANYPDGPDTFYFDDLVRLPD
jgi:hypothetical protein